MWTILAAKCGGAELDALVYSSATLDERFVARNLDLITALLPGLEIQLAGALKQPLMQARKA